MKNSPLVSVIMPTYNHAKWLRRAIDSVRKQTFSDWELIIWDDGSVDETKELVRSYNDERLKYYYDRNHGVAYARNQAIKFSQGTYLAFLDSDDEWVAEKLAIQVEVMDSRPQIGILFGDFLDINLVTEEKKLGFEQSSNGINLLDVVQIDESLCIIKAGMPESLVASNFICPSSVIVRRELLEKTGCFAEGLNGPEDFELWWRMGLAGAGFAYIRTVCVTRYKLPGSLSSPGILTYQRKIRALDLSLRETLVRGRQDLVPYLNRLYTRAWQNLIPLYGRKGDRKEMLKAFFQSMRYGINLFSVRLLFQALKNSNRPGPGTP